MCPHLMVHACPGAELPSLCHSYMFCFGCDIPTVVVAGIH
jgi:hypothetical protein